MAKRIPRAPTTEEKEQLIAYNLKRYYDNPTEEDREEQRGFTEHAAIAVFDDYITGSPGYVGKLMVVVWDGSPTFYDAYMCYTWHNGKIEFRAKEQ